ncbi:MAG TPA: Gfo/Idh/MocA family oxidoreductase [Pyrinomonadaceae bacterium]|jgi:predicted dehydrogenase
MKALKWGLIGAGDIARKRVAPALRDLPNCDFVAVSRSRSELAESFAAEFGALKWYADWREMLSDEEIEAVYIATPVHLHAEQTIAAARAGKHVLCEKPMALNVEECDEMLAACRANDVKLGVAYYRRFYPLIERIKRIISSGEIGKIAVAQINAFEYVDLAPDDPQHWFLEKEKSGGGPMMDFGCHRLEVLTNLFGAVTDLKSLVANVVFDREVEDTAIAVLQFANKICASLIVTHAALERQDTLDIFGTRGSIHIPVLNQPEMKIKTENGERLENHPTHQNTHQPLIEDFAEAVLANREPRVGGETGKAIAVLEERIYESYRPE